VLLDRGDGRPLPAKLKPQSDPADMPEACSGRFGVAELGVGFGVSAPRLDGETTSKAMSPDTESTTTTSPPPNRPP
jgi:hypothetical protein